jgi:hypothetical protein
MGLGIEIILRNRAPYAVWACFVGVGLSKSNHLPLFVLKQQLFRERCSLKALRQCASLSSDRCWNFSRTGVILGGELRGRSRLRAAVRMLLACEGVCLMAVASAWGQEATLMYRARSQR